ASKDNDVLFYPFRVLQDSGDFSRVPYVVQVLTPLREADPPQVDLAREAANDFLFKAPPRVVIVRRNNQPPQRAPPDNVRLFPGEPGSPYRDGRKPARHRVKRVDFRRRNNGVVQPLPVNYVDSVDELPDRETSLRHGQESEKLRPDRTAFNLNQLPAVVEPRDNNLSRLPVISDSHGALYRLTYPPPSQIRMPKHIGLKSGKR